MRRFRKKAHMRKHVLRRRRGDNPHDNMSFAEAFASEDWKEYEEAVRPCAEPAHLITSDTGQIEDSATTINFAPDGDMDEVSIMARFREYLVIKESDPESVQSPAPALVLWDFLDSLGRQELAFWRKLPMYSICRVRNGEIPISGVLSKQLSNVFGTRREFWSEMQREYDRWESRWSDGSPGEDDSGDD